MDDIQIAETVARAVRGVTGVADINPGRFVLVATYGPHERIPGVALRRTEDGALCVEVHVNLDASIVMLPSQAATSTPATGDGRANTLGAPALLSLADHIRLVIHDALHTLGIPPPARIDVAMDDMNGKV